MGWKTKKFLLILLPVLIIAAAIVFNTLEEKRSEVKNNDGIVTVKINDVEIKVEEARTPAQLKKGLSERKSLGKNKGLLFYLGQRRIAPFWMKGMKFTIDIIWIDKDRIVFIVENAPIPTGEDIPNFTPDKPATHVLEVNGGLVEENSLKVGDGIEIPEN